MWYWFLPYAYTIAAGKTICYLGEHAANAYAHFHALSACAAPQRNFFCVP